MITQNPPPTQLTPDQKFWVSVWKIATTGVVAIILIVAICGGYRDYQRTSLLATGKNPLEIACALK